MRVVENGRDWTAEELARVTVAPDEDPDDFAPLESAQAQIEALGYRVIALGGVGLYIMAHVEREITGETLTEDQCMEACSSGLVTEQVYEIAMGFVDGVMEGGKLRILTADEKANARVQVAAAINAHRRRPA